MSARVAEPGSRTMARWNVHRRTTRAWTMRLADSDWWCLRSPRQSGLLPRGCGSGQQSQQRQDLQGRRLRLQLRVPGRLEAEDQVMWPRDQRRQQLGEQCLRGRSRRSKGGRCRPRRSHDLLVQAQSDGRRVQMLPQVLPELERLLGHLQTQDSSWKVEQALAETTVGGLPGYKAPPTLTWADGTPVKPPSTSSSPGDIEYQLVVQAARDLGWGIRRCSMPSLPASSPERVPSNIWIHRRGGSGSIETGASWTMWCLTWSNRNSGRAIAWTGECNRRTRARSRSYGNVDHRPDRCGDPQGWVVRC